METKALTRRAALGALAACAAAAGTLAVPAGAEEGAVEVTVSCGSASQGPQPPGAAAVLEGCCAASKGVRRALPLQAGAALSVSVPAGRYLVEVIGGGSPEGLAHPRQDPYEVVLSPMSAHEFAALRALEGGAAYAGALDLVRKDYAFPGDPSPGGLPVWWGRCLHVDLGVPVTDASLAKENNRRAEAALRP